MSINYVELDDIKADDYPDFCDAFISYAEYKDGTPLTVEELDVLNKDNEFIYSWIMKELY